ncbi:polyadenylate binding family protein [Theileria parva strain Muguga]|uniref:Polyadenylate-binding protein n=1 Tax=Theileria parva TaxID=5875 RepID=Q4N775_THEPA|nr:polyadenylate binding family protein [Theileria parva strain Muguga]EAN34183.1 polyadenylate binding family protein [Theileria parva strain Muguga]|eukprot:XP_766466.1 polyadenylate binding protein [Theileria parva strain Muguga]
MASTVKPVPSENLMMMPMRDTQVFSSASLYVGDLKPDVTEAVLYEVFNTVGPVASIRVCRDSVTRKSLGYAYVNYYSTQDAQEALENLNYIEIKGHPTRIMWSNRDPSLRRSGAGNIFVKNLDKSIDTKSLYDTFSHFGPILSCKVAVDASGASKRYGFVHYENEESAREAIEKVNGMLIGGKRVEVAPFLRKQDRESEEVFTNLYVRNFPADWDEEALRQFLEKYGEITSMMLKEDSKGRRFAFVNYKEPEVAKEVVNTLNDLKLEESSEPLLVCPHQDKAKRQNLLRAQFNNSTMAQEDKRVTSNLYIKNLDDSFDDESLGELFKPFGTITSSKVMLDANNHSRGFGFVCFTNPQEATKAIAAMHLKLVKGKPLYVGLAEKRDQRMMRMQQRRGFEPHSRDVLFNELPSQSLYYPRPFPAPTFPNSVPGPNKKFPPNFTTNNPQANNYPPNYNANFPPVNSYANYSVRNVAKAPAANARNMSPMSSANIPSNIPHYPSVVPPSMAHVVASGNMGVHGNLPHHVVPPNMPHVLPGNMGVPSNMVPGAVGLRRDSSNPKTHQHQMPVSAFKFTPQARNREMPMHPQYVVNGNVQVDDVAMQKQMIGERLFPIIARDNPDLAGKITGMMLEIDNHELLQLLEDNDQLKAKIDEAIKVLKQAS